VVVKTTTRTRHARPLTHEKRETKKKKKREKKNPRLYRCYQHP